MPIEFNFENNHRGVVITAIGKLCGEDLEDVSRAVYNSDNHGRVQYQILDVSSIDRVHITLPSIARLAELDKTAAQRNGGMKIAVVIKSGLLEAITETWARYCDSAFLKTRICTDMATARRWIRQA